jgi:DNA polymerase zeta
MSKIRVVSVDHYMAKPVPGLDDLYSELRSEQISRVPVIRIFGVSEFGESCAPRFHVSFYSHLKLFLAR